MFYWVGAGEPPKESNPETDEDNWVEIWNDVFMQYDKQADGTYKPLKQQNVDTGMGLERTAAILQGKKTVYDTELFQPILEKIEALAKFSYKEKEKSYRVIADHLRAATMLAADGVKPCNVDQGYVMRRLIRRAIRHGKLVGIEQSFTHILAKKIIHTLSDIYPELNHEEAILATMKDEEEQFQKTVNHGLREFEKLLKGFEIAFEKTGKKTTEISGKQAFKLYDTYGFPIEMTEELAKEHELKVDKGGFEKAFKEHQEKSRADAGTFKGGLQDHSWETTRLHTATHLLHSALLKVLGDHAKQRGSNITAERLRFDFSHPEKLTEDQKTAVEKYVNDAIASDQKVTMRVVSIEEAKCEGAIGLFEEKYGDKVKIYDMGPWSKETCGGPHVEHLGQLSQFKIIKEQAIGAGLRRIKAVLVD
jgi:alanyl-tRNA synthetase